MNPKPGKISNRKEYLEHMPSINKHNPEAKTQIYKMYAIDRKLVN